MLNIPIGSDRNVVVDQGIDWITATAPLAGYTLYDLTKWASQHTPFVLEDSSPWSFFGYEGRQCDGIRVGERKDGQIIQISGNMASRLSHIIPKRFKATRIDAQVTVLFANPVPMAHHFNQLGKDGVLRERLRRTYIERDQGEGGTFYLGSRYSQHFGRVYDKGAQQKKNQADDILMQTLWRFEVELKQDAAEMFHVKHSEFEGDKEDFAGCFVYDWFTERGAPCYWQRGEADETVVAAYRRASTVDEMTRRLEWLRSTVRPAIDKLVGYHEECVVLAALGFDAGQLRAALNQLQHRGESGIISEG